MEILEEGFVVVDEEEAVDEKGAVAVNEEVEIPEEMAVFFLFGSCRHFSQSVRR